MPATLRVRAVRPWDGEGIKPVSTVSGTSRNHLCHEDTPIIQCNAAT